MCISITGYGTRNAGQNIAVGRTLGTMSSWDQAIRVWFAENQYFEFSNGSTAEYQPVKHYTQVGKIIDISIRRRLNKNAFIYIYIDLYIHFLKLFGRTHSHVLFGGHWYPCFGFLVTSLLGFKARAASALFALWR